MKQRILKRLSYAGAGVSRLHSQRSRERIYNSLRDESLRYSFGKPIRLPFGFVYPSEVSRREFYDLQIEGPGTKTLVAELAEKYDTIGMDAVAMTVNDVIRSGARPTLISDAILIGSTDSKKIGALIKGVRSGAKISNCILASGETENVPETLKGVSRSSSFDILVSCLGVAKQSLLITGDIGVGDVIIGLRSSGIHSNGLTLARKVLLKRWGGKFGAWDKPQSIGRSIVEELLEPTRIYVESILKIQHSNHLKAAVHITGDGFAKFHRLLRSQRKFKQSAVKFGLKFEGLRKMPAIFKLIHDTAKSQRASISMVEMFRTFNMGYGFAVIVKRNEAEEVLDLLSKNEHAEKIGLVTSDGNISVSSPDLERRLVI